MYEDYHGIVPKKVRSWEEVAREYEHTPAAASSIVEDIRSWLDKYSPYRQDQRMPQKEWSG